MLSRRSPASDFAGPAVAAHLLGVVDFDACLALQQRLVYEASGSRDGRITLLLCEHPPLITVGRQGSRAHIRLSERELQSRQLDVRWINRGGGCLLHAPGQLAVYPIVPLGSHRLTVGDYLRRLEAGVAATLAELDVPTETRPGCTGLWTRSGQVAVFGAAVKSWTTYHGAFINVCPAMPPFRHVVTDPTGRTRMTSLVLQRQRPVKMTSVREGLIRHLTAAFGCDRYHLYTGHSLLPRPSQPLPNRVRRVG